MSIHNCYITLTRNPFDKPRLARMRATVALLAFAFPFGAVGADEIRYAIVSGVESFKKMSGESNLYPWEGASSEDEIVISNACGFAEVVYNKVTAPGFSRIDEKLNLKPWKALVLMGEWCHIKEFIQEDLTLVAYNAWEGENYVVGYTEILADKNNLLYVDIYDQLHAREMGFEDLPSSAAKRYEPADCTRKADECPMYRLYLGDLYRKSDKLLKRGLK